MNYFTRKIGVIEMITSYNDILFWTFSGWIRFEPDA